MKYSMQSKLVVSFRNRQEQNNDVLLAVTGDRGDGKSNFALEHAKRYVLLFGLVCKDCGHDWITTKKLTEKTDEGIRCDTYTEQPCPTCDSENVKKQTRFDFKKYLAYNYEQIMEKIHNLPMYSPLIGDEAMRWASREDWMLRENKAIKQLFSQDRTKRLIKYIVIQRFVKLDKLLQSYCDYWVKVLQRKDDQVFAHVLTKSKGEVEDPWNLKLYEELFKDYHSGTSIEDLEKRTFRLKKHPNFSESMMIPKFPTDEYAKYQVYRDEHVYTKKETNKGITNEKLSVYNLHKEGMSFREIAKKLFFNPITNKESVSYATVKRWVDEVKETMEDS